MSERIKKGVSVLLLLLIVCGVVFTEAPLTAVAEGESFIYEGRSFEERLLPDGADQEMYASSYADTLGSVDSPTFDIDLGNLEIEEEVDTVIVQAFDDIVGPLADAGLSSPLTPQYGSNGKFLAPIEAPVAGSIPISNRAELEAIRDNLSDNYHLAQDIDLSDAEWVPIGDNYTESSDSRFTGTFDGQGHVISNLIITEDYEYAGLFGYVEGAALKNIGMEGSEINVFFPYDLYAINTGGICGGNDGAISDCYNTGSVSASSYSRTYDLIVYIGSICGNNESGLIDNCYNIGKVSASSSVSDLESYNNTSYIYTGGICGRSGGVISDCYNTGDVSASAYRSYEISATGICSINEGTINNCYNTGTVSALSNYFASAGGISMNNSGIISNCYNIGVIFTSATNICSGGICNSNSGSISNCYNMGDVAANIIADSSGFCSASSGGVCNGNSGTITNCYNTGDVTASVATDYVASTSATAGGICSSISNGGAISDCYNGGAISASTISTIREDTTHSARAGGICGDNWGYGSASTIINCYNMGTVSATASSNNTWVTALAGGICGDVFSYDASVIVSNCYNTGNITARTDNDSGTSYASCYAGGINGMGATLISNCYNIGSVSTDSSSTSIYTGGICGYSGGEGIGNSYWMLESSQTVNGVQRGDIDKRRLGNVEDTLIGRLTSAQMKDAVNFTGFDFDTVWDISQAVNGGYPFLRDLPPDSSGGGTPQTSVISITEQPALVTNITPRSISGSLNVAASVTQSATLSYQWYSNPSNSNVGGTAIPGATNSTFIIPTILTTGTYYYFCEISASGGAASQRSNVATVNVNTQGFGSNGKFLAPIEAPVAGSIAISNRTQLENIKNNLSGNYHLTQDIDLSGVEWTPIGEDYSNEFTGTLDGQGYVIHNLTITGERSKSYEFVALFGYASGAVIKNIGLEETLINVTTGEYTSAISVSGICNSFSDNVISNCYNAGIVAATTISGSITACGICYSGYVSNCYNNCTITASANADSALSPLDSIEAYGICSYKYGAIENCYNTGAISISSGNSNNYNSAEASGICRDNYAVGTISDCYNEGDITVTTNGYASISGICNINSGNISNCYNTGNIAAFSSSYLFSGGICCSHGDSTGVIRSCYNTGDIFALSTSSYAYINIGGICGSVDTGGNVIIKDCYNMGAVTGFANGGNEAYVGGIFGRSYSSYKNAINNCYNLGAVSVSASNTDNAYTGGISGEAYDENNISNAYWNSECEQIVNGVSRDDAEKRIVGSLTDTTTGRLTTAQMKDAANFANFDFETVWDISPAVNDGYPFLRDLSPNEENTVMPGDVSGDGKINMQDVLLIYQSFRGKVIFTGGQIAAADVSGDGLVNMVDVLMVYQYFRGKIVSLH